jgi:CrcB protein
MAWLAVAVLGGVGALARFLLDGAVSQRAGTRFPIGTLAVNLSGSLLLGLCAGVVLNGDAALVVQTALLGSYTTFSTWMFEAHRLGEDGQPAVLWLNVALSLALGLAAVALGRAIGDAL